MYEKTSIQDQFVVVAQLTLKSIFKSRNWVFYIILTFIPLLFTLPTNDKLVGAEDYVEAFLFIMIFVQVTIFFTFGCLFISLPVTSDEISDHTIDLIVTRPIRRELLYFTKWLSLLLSIIIINLLIAFVYFVYFLSYDIVGRDLSVLDFLVNYIPSLPDILQEVSLKLDLLGRVLLFIVAETFVYGSLFLVIGMIGSRGFVLGIFIAFFEFLIGRLLFLQNDQNLPGANLSKIGYYLFRSYTGDTREAEALLPNIEYSTMYVIVVPLVLLLIGIYYIRRKEFN